MIIVMSIRIASDATTFLLERRKGKKIGEVENEKHPLTLSGEKTTCVKVTGHCKMNTRIFNATTTTID